jgi:hypothetical protein
MTRTKQNSTIPRNISRCLRIGVLALALSPVTVGHGAAHAAPSGDIDDITGNVSQRKVMIENHDHTGYLGVQSTAQGAPIIAFDSYPYFPGYVYDAKYKWYMIQVGPERVRFRNAATGLCIYPSSKAAGAILIQYSCAHLPSAAVWQNQQAYRYQSNGAWYDRFKSEYSGQMMQVEQPFSLTANVIQEPFDYERDQGWRVRDVS